MRSLNATELFSVLRAFLVGGRFLRTTPHYSRDQMRDWQWQRIKRLVGHAFDNVEFYRDHYRKVGFAPGDLKSWDDFHRLPSVSKDQVIAAYPGRMIARGYRLDDLVVSRSSGSSGKPLDIAYDSRAMTIYTLAGLRLYGMGFSYRPWHRQLYVYTSPYPLDSLFGLYPLTFVSTLAPIADIIAALKKTRPQLLVCYPSHLKQIEQNLTDTDLSELHLRAISVNSEMSSQAERDMLAKRFGCPVLDEYSSEELTRIAAQCRHGTYHVFEDINYLEAVPDKMRADGIGPLIGTNLHNHAMPMIRYEQNDLGAIGEASCACGWKFRSLISLQGRRNDSFILPSGREISSGFLLDATYEILLTYRTEVKDFCLIQAAANRIVLEIVPGAAWNNAISEALSARFASFFEQGVAFEIREVTECTKTKSGKRNPIISHVRAPVPSAIR
ncbi:MAG: phenylacetate--CoA ligase family protein [Alphaproteobacteria bacterium]|nr:phenylacetate--CoA ligase family protein [Alphaproteobacteria bacterium]